MPRRAWIRIVLIAAVTAGPIDPVQCSAQVGEAAAVCRGIALCGVSGGITRARSASEGMDAQRCAFPRSRFGLVWSTNHETSATASAATEPAEQDAAVVANKAQKRRAVILIMLVAGIALTGLLLLIAAIVVRGFLREAQFQAETKRQAELKRSTDVLKEAVKDPDVAGDSLPLSERETEVT